jgi:hypothetical protein
MRGSIQHSVAHHPIKQVPEGSFTAHIISRTLLRAAVNPRASMPCNLKYFFIV